MADDEPKQTVEDLFGDDSDSDAPIVPPAPSAPPAEAEAAAGPTEEDLFGADSDEEEEEEAAAAAPKKKKGSAEDEDEVEEEEEEEEDAGARQRRLQALAEAEAAELDERDPSRVEANGPPSLVRAERMPAGVPGGAALKLVRFPNTFGLEQEPFDPATYQAQEERDTADATTGRRRIRLGAENLVRWRKGKDGKVESNARLVTWSDGSVHLFVGGEALSLSEQPYADERSFLYARVPRVGGGSASDAGRRRSTRHVVEEVKGLAAQQSRGLFVGRMAFQVAAGTKSASHRKLKNRVKDLHFRGSRVKRTMQDADVGALREEALRRQAEKEREQRRLRSAKEKARAKGYRRRSGAGAAPAGRYAAEELGEEEDSEGSDFFERGAVSDGEEAEYDASRKRGRDYGDEAERGSRLMQLKGDADSDGASMEEEEEEEAGAGGDDGVHRVRRSAAKRRKVLGGDDDDE